MEQLASQQEKHLTAKCPQHNIKVTSVGKADGTYQFYCKLCKTKGNEKIYHLADVLDDDIMSLIDLRILDQVRNAGNVEEKQQALLQFLDTTFEAIKRDLANILKEAQEKLQKKFLGFMQEKRSQELNWIDIKEDFETKKANFLNGTPLEPTEQLDKYLTTYSTVMECLAHNIETEKTQDYEFNREEITRFRKNFETQADILAERLLKFNFSHMNVKIEGIKEESVINAEHKGVFKALTTLDDLNMFATGTTDGELALWDCDNLKQVKKFKAHKTFITSLLYIPQKKLLVTASLDRTIKVFEVSDKKINENATVLNGHKSFIYGLCYLEDQNRFVSVGQDPDIKVWNPDTLKLDFTIPTDGWGSDSYEVIYIQDEGWIGVVGKDVIRLYSYHTKKLVHEIKTGGLSMQSIQYLKRQKAIVVAVEKGKIMVYAVEAGTVRQDRAITFEDVGDTPYTILALEEQNLLAVTTRSKFICFINLKDGKLVKKGTVLKDGIAVAFLKSQGKMIVADNSSDKIVVFGL